MTAYLFIFFFFGGILKVKSMKFNTMIDLSKKFESQMTLL